MDHHHKEYEERCGNNDREFNESRLEDQWIIVVDSDDERAHQKKTKLDPTLAAEIKRRSNERLSTSKFTLSFVKINYVSIYYLSSFLF